MLKIGSKHKKGDYDKRTKDFTFGSRKFEGAPRHVAIICDGNRRWAEENGLSVLEGHLAGADNIMDLVERAGELGIPMLTVWVMDTKNLHKRSKDEIKNLMKIFLHYGKKFREEYLSEDIRFRHLGAKKYLPRKVLDMIRELESETAHKQTATLNVAFNYGGRDEIVRATQKIIEAGLQPEDVTEETFAQYLDTRDMDDPDMIIRTGKELRLSGLMSWQSAPSELFFPQYLFPDFTPDVFESVVREFPMRGRRLGR